MYIFLTKIVFFFFITYYFTVGFIINCNKYLSKTNYITDYINIIYAVVIKCESLCVQFKYYYNIVI
jgi:hypothetical protein